MDWLALYVTLRLAFFTSGILCVCGIPLAYWLAKSRWPGKILVEAVVSMPLVLPPTVLGFYLLVSFGPHSVIGKLYAQWVGGTIPFSFTGLLIASVISSLPFAVRPFTVGFAAVDQRWLEASWCLGESRGWTFLRVVLPLAWPGILTGFIMSFAHTLGEFGVVLMVGGNIPGITRTISISIYDNVQMLRYAEANRAALLLLLVAFFSMSVTYAWQRRMGTP